MKRKSPNQTVERKNSDKVEQIGRSDITLISKFLLGTGVPRRNGRHNAGERQLEEVRTQNSLKPMEDITKPWS